MPQRRTFAMLLVLYSTAFLAAFNENLVNVSLVDIMAEFEVAAETAQWLVTGYMLVTAIVVTISAFLYRRLGLRRLFFAGAGFPLAASVMGALAPSFAVLLGGRLVQAVGTGIFIPAMMSTVLAVAPRPRLGFYLAMGGCMITFGPAVAPVVSGLMVTTTGWRSSFWPPTIVTVVLLVLGAVLVHDVASPVRLRLEARSVALSALGLLGFVSGLSVVAAQPAVGLALILAGLGVLAGFVVRQFRLDQPLLDLRPMQNRRFRPATVLVLVTMVTTFSMSVLLPLYFQAALGLDAFAAGALLLVPILVNAGLALVGGRVMDRFGSWPLLFIGVLGSRSAAAVAAGMTQAGAQAVGFSAAVVVATAIALVGLVVALRYARPAGGQRTSPPPVGAAQYSGARE